MRLIKIFQYRIFPLAFLAVLLLPFINVYIPIFELKESKENRALAEFPKFEIKHLDPFPNAFEEYYNDHFTFRNNITSFYNYIRFKQNINPNPKKVVLGKENWMFTNSPYLPNLRQSTQYDKKELQQFAEELNSRNQFLKEHNCDFYIGIIPPKVSIYYDKLKESQYDAGQDTIMSRAEQLVNYLNNTSDIKISYLKDSLLAYKSQFLLYKQYDHHWNLLGGFIASKSMLGIIQQDYPSIDMTISLDEYNVNYDLKSGGDLAQLLGIQEYCLEELPILVLKNKDEYPKQISEKSLIVPEEFAYGWGYEIRKTTNDLNRPNCMVIRDSYGSYFNDFLSRGFNNTLFLWDQWKYTLNKEIFLKEKPDVLIIMIPETALNKFITKPQ